MYYYIDGYNLLFSLIDSSESLALMRKKIIRFLQKQFSLLKMTGMVVFDGMHRRDEERGLSYASPLEIAYAPKGQSADDYIVEKLSLAKNPHQITVVTNDKALRAHARSFHAKILSNGAFISSLSKKRDKNKPKKIEVSDTKQNIERLQKIFEQRLNEGL